MARQTKQELLDEIDRLNRRIERLVQDRDEYSIRMQNAEREAEKLKRLMKTEQIIEQPQNPKRGRPSRITEEQRRRVRDLHEAGATIRTICAETGVSVGSVHRILHDGTG